MYEHDMINHSQYTIRMMYYGFFTIKVIAFSTL